MKKTTFIATFIGAHIVFIVLQIHKSNLITQQSYQKQKNERAKLELVQRSQELTHKKSQLLSHAHVTEFARDHLNMKPVNLTRIKKMKRHEHTS